MRGTQSLACLSLADSMHVTIEAYLAFVAKLVQATRTTVCLLRSSFIRSACLILFLCIADLIPV